jgi:hypothetical protein
MILDMGKIVVKVLLIVSFAKLEKFTRCLLLWYAELPPGVV